MIQLENLRRHFGATLAVDGVTLRIERGEVFGLLGPNGAGKTTTIALVTGLLEPDDGRVVIGDSGSPLDPETRARIGIAPQALALYEDLTGEENLRFFGSLYGIPAPRLRKRTAELLEMTGLTEKRRLRVKAFSGGMKRRLNLAAALVHEPEILLLDEPTAGVDPQSRNAIFDLVGTLRDEGRTVVYTTHYMEEAQRLCDRVAILDHGKVLALDRVDALITAHGGQSIVTLERADGKERVLTANPAADLPDLIARGDVLAMHVERPNLEAVFLNLTGRSLRD